MAYRDLIKLLLKDNNNNKVNAHILSKMKEPIRSTKIYLSEF